MGVVPDLEGNRHVAVRFYVAGRDARCSVVLTTADALQAAATVRALMAAPAPETSLRFLGVPETEALQITLRGNELLWLTYASALLGGVMERRADVIEAVLSGVRQYAPYASAAAALLRKCDAAVEIVARFTEAV